VPLLLFGTSFTRAPRLTRAFFEDVPSIPLRQGAPAAVEAAFTRAFERRTDDFLRALRSPGTNERMLWARATLERLGHRVDTPAGLAGAGRFLVESFARVTRESEALVSQLTTASSASDPSAFARRAHAFAERGLAPDTGWPINFALSEALRALQASGALEALLPIRRIAIVGPGLEFVDKDEGLDYYPPQTLQPFAVIDAVARAGLAKASAVSILTLDLNPRVNDHLRRARSAARPYVLQLVATDRPWTDDAVAYWATFGAAIGDEVPPATPPDRAGVRSARALRLRDGIVKQIDVVDANMVHQRVDIADRDRVDLVVATNVLLYYDTAEQALAVSNMAHLLRPGGLILTNTRLDETTSPGLTMAGETRTTFSSRSGDGEVVYAYRPTAAR
jgi:SAM-dependent methyltransferase